MTTSVAGDRSSLLSTMTANAGSGGDADQSDEIRFVRGVQRALRKRLVAQDEAPSGRTLAVFLMSALPGGELFSAPVRKPLLDSGRYSFEGAIWLVAPTVLSGTMLTYPDELEDEELFSLVCDNLELGSVPAVLYDPGDPDLHFYPNGLDDAETVETVKLQRSVPNLADVKDVIDRIHQYKLVSPSAQDQVLSVWANKASYCPKSNAEAVVQSIIETALWTGLSDCLIVREYTQVTGRFDLAVTAIDPVDPSIRTHLVVLELKVLRTYGQTTSTRYSPEQVRQWVEEGVNQAYSYAQEFSAREQALCCFDMRSSEDPATFSHVQDRADTLGVKLFAWRIYNSDSALRADLAAAASQDA